MPIADYSLPAAGAYPVVEARRLSIRRRAGFQSARYAGAVCPHYVLPLGYEHYGARLRCLAQPPVGTLARPDFRPGVLADPRRLRRCAVSCCVPFTDPITTTVIFCRCWAQAHTAPERVRSC